MDFKIDFSKDLFEKTKGFGIHSWEIPNPFCFAVFTEQFHKYGCMNYLNNIKFKLWEKHRAWAISCKKLKQYDVLRVFVCNKPDMENQRSIIYTRDVKWQSGVVYGNLFFHYLLKRDDFTARLTFMWRFGKGITLLLINLTFIFKEFLMWCVFNLYVFWCILSVL